MNQQTQNPRDSPLPIKSVLKKEPLRRYGSKGGSYYLTAVFCMARPWYQTETFFAMVVLQNSQPGF